MLYDVNDVFSFSATMHREQSLPKMSSSSSSFFFAGERSASVFNGKDTDDFYSEVSSLLFTRGEFLSVGLFKVSRRRQR